MSFSSIELSLGFSMSHSVQPYGRVEIRYSIAPSFMPASLKTGSSGKVLVDGKDITDMSRTDVREMFGMVLQDTMLFSGSVYDNIAYGKEGATFEEVMNAANGEIGLLALVLLFVIILWIAASNRLTLTAVHPQLAGSRGIPVRGYETLFTVSIAVVVTLAMGWVGLMVINSLLVLPAAAARNIARNMREYHLFSILGALAAGILGLITSYYLGCSTGAVISLYLALYFTITFCLRKRRA